MRVLVVEDDVTLAAGLVEGLERESFQVDHLGAAEPAENVFGHTDYDLAIVDIGLPGMDGLELTGREWNVLEQLAIAVPRVVGKQKLADSLSQWDKEITPNAVEIYVSRLRGKLADSGVSIRTVRGVGYRIEVEDA